MEPTPVPTFEPVMDGKEVSRAIFEGFAHAAIDWWYVWVLFVVVIVAATLLTDWSKRAEQRGKPRRR